MAFFTRSSFDSVGRTLIRRPLNFARWSLRAFFVAFVASSPMNSMNATPLKRIGLLVLSITMRQSTPAAPSFEQPWKSSTSSVLVASYGTWVMCTLVPTPSRSCWLPSSLPSNSTLMDDLFSFFLLLSTKSSFDRLRLLPTKSDARSFSSLSAQSSSPRGRPSSSSSSSSSSSPMSHSFSSSSSSASSTSSVAASAHSLSPSGRGSASRSPVLSASSSLSSHPSSLSSFPSSSSG
mmetsp:Transcript_6412/g.15492  ORF Transcript_6412/g.15492 Transcript_6412/m.15492 type:complete len:235 (-) Transcript_6412:118-822(-)